MYYHLRKIERIKEIPRENELPSQFGFKTLKLTGRKFYLSVQCRLELTTPLFYKYSIVKIFRLLTNQWIWMKWVSKIIKYCP